jgi:hypothetical protein
VSTQTQTRARQTHGQHSTQNALLLQQTSLWRHLPAQSLHITTHPTRTHTLNFIAMDLPFLPDGVLPVCTDLCASRLCEFECSHRIASEGPSPPPPHAFWYWRDVVFMHLSPESSSDQSFDTGLFAAASTGTTFIAMPTLPFTFNLRNMKACKERIQFHFTQALPGYTCCNFRCTPAVGWSCPAQVC